MYPLNGKESTLGRDTANSVVLNDEQISKKHAMICFENGSYRIKDTESKNGVFVNGRKINGSARLLETSLIKLGNTILRFETNGKFSKGD